MSRSRNQNPEAPPTTTPSSTPTGSEDAQEQAPPPVEPEQAATPEPEQEEQPEAENTLGVASGVGSPTVQELEIQVGKLEHDNEELIKQVRAAENKIDEWRRAVGVAEDEDPSDAIKKLNDTLELRDKRVREFQMAMSLGEGEDPAEKMREIILASRGDLASELGDLPGIGLLLLFPILAQIADFEGFKQCPTAIYIDGDEWTASVDLVPGAPIVTIDVRYGEATYRDALIALKETETLLAHALRSQEGAKKALERLPKRNRDEVSARAVEENYRRYTAQVREFKSKLDRIAPLTEVPKRRTWRFSGKLDDFGQGAL